MKRKEQQARSDLEKAEERLRVANRKILEIDVMAEYFELKVGALKKITRAIVELDEKQEKSEAQIRAKLHLEKK